MGGGTTGLCEPKTPVARFTFMALSPTPGTVEAAERGSPLEAILGGCQNYGPFLGPLDTSY